MSSSFTSAPQPTPAQHRAAARRQAQEKVNAVKARVAASMVDAEAPPHQQQEPEQAPPQYGALEPPTINAEGEVVPAPEHVDNPLRLDNITSDWRVFVLYGIGMLGSIVLYRKLSGVVGSWLSGAAEPVAGASAATTKAVETMASNAGKAVLTPNALAAIMQYGSPALKAEFLTPAL